MQLLVENVTKHNTITTLSPILTSSSHTPKFASE